MTQREKAFDKINHHLGKLERAKNHNKFDLAHTEQIMIVGMLSLAKELEIITTEEYEIFFEKIFN